MMSHDHDSNGNSLNNNNNNNKMTSRKVIITRKASISDDSDDSPMLNCSLPEENNNLQITLSNEKPILFSIDSGNMNRCYSGGNVTTVLKPQLQIMPTLQQQQQHQQQLGSGNAATAATTAKFRRFLSPASSSSQDCNSGNGNSFNQGQCV